MSQDMKKFQVPGKVKSVNGSILAPQNAGLRFVLNSLSLSGKPESELFTLFNKKWGKVREESRGWYASRQNFKLGATSTTPVQSDVWVITMLVKDENNNVDDKALDLSLKKVCDQAKYEKASVHISNLLIKDMPSLMDKVSSVFTANGVTVYLYEE